MVSKEELVEITKDYLLESYRDYTDDIDILEMDIEDLYDNLNYAKSYDDEEEIEYYEEEIAKKEKELEELKAKWQKEYDDFKKTLPPETNKTDFPNFNLTETDPSFWESFIPGHKDRDYLMKKYGYTLAYIAEVTPEQYLQLCSKYGWNKEREYSLDNIIKGLPEKDTSYLDTMTKAMERGEKFDLPFIDVLKNSQEGRHRALAAMKAGIKTIPCLILA